MGISPRIVGFSLLLGSILCLGVTPADAKNPPVGEAVTIEGYVIDSACAITKGLKKPISKDCAIACANAGSPLVVLGDDGTIYWPLSDEMPATSQNDRLMKFAGDRVSVKGKFYERGGTCGLVIDSVELLPPGR